MWCDRDALDAAFDPELVRELSQADTIVLAVSHEGLGRYQEKNELDRIVEALKRDSQRRLVIASIGGAKPPGALEIFDPYTDRRNGIAVSADDASANAVLTECGADIETAIAEGTISAILNDVMKRFWKKKHLVIVVGPYAYAEGEHREATPAKAIERFVYRHKLEGAPPWIDVMGSIAYSMGWAVDETVEKILDALRGDEARDKSGLGVYLRLIAANWQRTPGLGKLVIINTMPDEWIDLALGSDSFPVEHIKLIHNPRDNERLQIKHVHVIQGKPKEVDRRPDDPELDKYKVLLIKPFGSVASDEAAQKAMLTADDWRIGVQPMALPFWATEGMTSAVLFVLGAGMFTPNLQVLFKTILHTLLEQKTDNPYRYLLHNPAADAEDPLHKIESFLIKNKSDKSDSSNYSQWIWDTYRLKVHSLDTLRLLVAIEHHLNRGGVL